MLSEFQAFAKSWDFQHTMARQKQLSKLPSRSSRGVPIHTKPSLNGAILQQLGWKQVRANVCLVGELKDQCQDQAGTPDRNVDGKTEADSGIAGWEAPQIASFTVWRTYTGTGFTG